MGLLLVLFLACFVNFVVQNKICPESEVYPPVVQILYSYYSKAKSRSPEFVEDRVSTILVIEDEAALRQTIIEMLEYEGFDTLSARDGQVGLEMAQKHLPDLILCDVMMPVMNGIEMVEKMQENGTLEATPVVIVSTERSTTRIEYLKSKGISAYLSKPFTPESLKETIDDLLSG